MLFLEYQYILVCKTVFRLYVYVYVAAILDIRARAITFYSFHIHHHQRSKYACHGTERYLLVKSTCIE